MLLTPHNPTTLKNMNKDDLKELTLNQEKSVQLYIGGMKISEVAKKCKIDRSTFYDWLELPRVQSLLSQLVDEIKTHQRNKLCSLYNKALETIERSLNSQNENVAF